MVPLNTVLKVKALFDSLKYRLSYHRTPAGGGVRVTVSGAFAVARADRAFQPSSLQLRRPARAREAHTQRHIASLVTAGAAARYVHVSIGRSSGQAQGRDPSHAAEMRRISARDGRERGCRYRRRRRRRCRRECARQVVHVDWLPGCRDGRGYLERLGKLRRQVGRPSVREPHALHVLHTLHALHALYALHTSHASRASVREARRRAKRAPRAAHLLPPWAAISAGTREKGRLGTRESGYLARELSGPLVGRRLERQQVRRDLGIKLLQRVHDDRCRVQAERHPAQEPRDTLRNARTTWLSGGARKPEREGDAGWC